MNGFAVPSLRKIMFWLLVIMVASFLTGILIAVVDHHPSEKEDSWTDVFVPSGPVEQVKSNLDIASGDINLSGGDTPGIIAGWVLYRHALNPPRLTCTVAEGVGSIGIDRSSNMVYDLFPGDEDWNLTLNRSVPAELRASVGTGDILLNTSDTSLSSVYLESGVGQILLDESRWSGRRQSVHIESGMGDITALFPERSRVSVTIDKGIGENNLFGFDNHVGGYTHQTAVPGAPEFDVMISQGLGDVTIRVV